MEKNHQLFDIGIIGAGIGGLTAALEAGQNGLNVVLFEKRNLGGVAFNGGDILLRKFYNYLNDISLLHLDTHQQPLKSQSIKELLALFKHNQKQHIADYIDLFAGLKNIKVVYDKASLINQNTIKTSNKTYKFNSIVLAYGQTPRLPKIKGLEESLKSGFLRKAHELVDVENDFNKVAIIGSGRIAFSLASFLSSVGVDVYVLARNGFLNHLDDDIKKIYLNLIQKDNLYLIDNTSLTEIKNQTIYYQKDNKKEKLEVDVALVAMGFKPNNNIIENLNFAIDSQGIITNDFLQTNYPNIYAVGDCNNKDKFSSLAIAEAITAINHISGHKIPLDYNNFVRNNFLTYQYSSYGNTEKYLINHKIPYFKLAFYPEKQADFKQNVKYVKILIHKYTRALLGLSAVGLKLDNEINAIINVVNNPIHKTYENRYSIFSNAHYIGKLLINMLRKHDAGIINDNLVNVYQPKYDTQTLKIVGCEVLSRFNVDGKYHNPMPFIDAFESNETIINLDLKVLENSCKVINELESLNLIDDDFTISINLSPLTLDTVTIEKLKEIVLAHNVKNSRITFELTERVTKEKIDLFKAIEKLKQCNARLSMDDFSVGHSSLALLKYSLLDEVKIDMSLLPKDQTDKDGEIIYQKMVAILKQLNVSIVAEGVETKYHYNLVKKLKVDEVQGYYFSKPLTKEELFSKLKTKKQ